MTMWNEINNWLAIHENVRLFLVLFALIAGVWLLTNWRRVSDWLRGKLNKQPVAPISSKPVTPVSQTEPFTQPGHVHPGGPQVPYPPPGYSGYAPNLVATQTADRLRQNQERLISDLSQVTESLALVEDDIRNKKALWDQLRSQKRTLDGMLEAVKQELDAVDRVLLNSRVSTETPRPLPPKPGEPSVEQLFNDVTKK